MSDSPPENEFSRLIYHVHTDSNSKTSLTQDIGDISFNLNTPYFANSNEIRSSIYDAYLGCLTGRLSVSKVSACIQQYFKNNEEVAVFCVNLLSTFDIECQVNKSLQRTKYIQLLQSSFRYFPENIIKEYIESETLEESGLIKSAKLFNQKLVRLKTKLFYKQKKYNLLREENEGYTKLMVHLQSLKTADKKLLQKFVDDIISIIGYFSLDPYRVFDLLLTYFETIDQSISISIIKNLMNQTGELSINEILSFKFMNPKTASPAFFDLLASLIENEIVTLSQIYTKLLPSDEDLLLKIKLIEKSEEDDLKKANSMTLSECTKFSKQPFKTSSITDCPKISLLGAFIRRGYYPGIDFYLARFSTLLLMRFTDVSKSIFANLHDFIEPLYSNLSQRLVNKPQDPCTTLAGKSISELHPHIFKYIKFIGHSLYQDSLLFIKIVRLFTFIIKKYYSGNDEIKGSFNQVWRGIIMSICCCFLPSLSFMESNCVASEELWHLVKQFPYSIRFKIYGEHKNTSFANNKQLQRLKTIVSKHSKFICKRITKDNVKLCGRQIGKLTHSNAIVVMTEIINQICNFESMIIPIVDCLKYLSQLSYDILLFCIIETLSYNSLTLTSKITSIPEVIQHLGVFCSHIMRKYNVSLTGILQYIANQLKDGNPLDLIVLREVLHKMAGIQEQHLNASQIQALAGSETLRDEAGVGLLVKSHKKSALRVTEALVECNLAFPLFFLISQQRDRFIYDKTLNELHIKLAGQLFDQCHQTLVQYGRFISKYIPISDFFKNIQFCFSVLLEEYGLNMETCFFLIRHVFRTEMLKTSKTNLFNQSLNLLLQRYNTSLSHHLPCKVSDSLPTQLICAFWLLDLYDIYFPEAKYLETLQKCSQLQLSFEESRDNNSKKNKEKERLIHISKVLAEDQEAQRIHIDYIKKWVFDLYSNCFTPKSSKSEFVTYFYQFCIYSRSIYSATDAVYCAKFVFLLHELRLQNFSTITCFDRILSDNFHIIACLSEHEANNYGLFLNAFLEHLSPWHGSKTIYKENCFQHPGFLSVLKQSNDPDKADPLEYENFRHLMFKWHYKLSRSFIICLESGDFIQIRNSIIILTRLTSSFPKIVSFKNAISKRVDKLIEEEKEKRPDLYALVTCYSGILKNMKDSLVEEADFHLKDSVKEDKILNFTSNANPTSISSMDSPHVDQNEEKVEDVKKTENGVSRHKSRHISDGSNGEAGLKPTILTPPERRPKKSTEKQIIIETDNSIAYSEKSYSLRNADRKRTTIEDGDELKLKRRKDNEHEHRNITHPLRNQGSIAEYTSLSMFSSKKRQPSPSNDTLDAEPKDRPVSKVKIESQANRRKSHELQLEGVKSSKKEEKKRKT